MPVDLDQLTRDQRRQYRLRGALNGTASQDEYLRQIEEGQLRQASLAAIAQIRDAIARRQGGGLAPSDTQGLPSAAPTPPATPTPPAAPPASPPPTPAPDMQGEQPPPETPPPPPEEPAPAPAPARSTLAGMGAMRPSRMIREHPDYYKLADRPEMKQFVSDVEAQEAEEAAQQGLGSISFDEAEQQTVYSGLLKAGMYKMAAEYAERVGGGGAGRPQKWAEQAEEWDRISAMPDGPDKKKAERNHLMKYNPAVGWASSDEAVAQRKRMAQAGAEGSATGRIQTESEMAGTQAATEAQIAGARSAASESAKIGTQSRLAGVQAETEAEIQAAKTEAAETSRVTTQYKNAANGLWDVSGPEAEKLVNAASATDALVWMADEIDKGNVGIFDLTGAGKVIDPRVYQKSKIIGEYYARPLSGAAINDKEWAQFKSETLTPAYMATAEGKRAASERLRELADNMTASGAMVTKDIGWVDKIRSYQAPATASVPLGGPKSGASRAPAKPRPSAPTTGSDRVRAMAKSKYGVEY